MTLNDFLNAANIARNVMEKEPMGLKVTKEFNSYHDFKDTLDKQARGKLNPKDKQKVPLTMSQEIGWDKEFFDNSEKDYHPLNTSSETRYAEAMVKQGEYF